jgi:hypothetical protein
VPILQDVSGFTAMSEDLAKRGAQGAEMVCNSAVWREDGDWAPIEIALY